MTPTTLRDPIQWRISSYSADQGGNCVEVGFAADRVAIRDTKDRSGGMLTISRSEWRTCLSAIGIVDQQVRPI